MILLEKVKEKVLVSKQLMIDCRSKLKASYNELISSDELVFELQDEAKAAIDCIDSIDAYITAGDVMIATIEMNVNRYATED